MLKIAFLHLLSLSFITKSIPFYKKSSNFQSKVHIFIKFCYLSLQVRLFERFEIMVVYTHHNTHKIEVSVKKLVKLLVLRDFSHKKLLKLLQILLQENLQDDMIINVIGVILIT